MGVESGPKLDVEIINTIKTVLFALLGFDSMKKIYLNDQMFSKTAYLLHI